VQLQSWERRCVPLKVNSFKSQMADVDPDNCLNLVRTCDGAIMQAPYASLCRHTPTMACMPSNRDSTPHHTDVGADEGSGPWCCHYIIVWLGRSVSPPHVRSWQLRAAHARASDSDEASGPKRRRAAWASGRHEPWAWHLT
jgi:hypothetical protein